MLIMTRRTIASNPSTYNSHVNFNLRSGNNSLNMSSNGSSISMSGGSMGGSKNGFMNLSLCFKKFNRNYGSEWD